MPIISKKRFYEHVNPLCRLHSDYALLILCMDLTTWIPGSQIEDPRTPNYLAAKRYYLELEISGLLSIQALQSGILIAVFEFGHAIYPSALHSVASCISYGSSLGLDWRTASSSGSTQSWLDTEEKIRIFWAIVLLDRYTLLFTTIVRTQISCGSQNTPLQCVEFQKKPCSCYTRGQILSVFGSN